MNEMSVNVVQVRLSEAAKPCAVQMVKKNPKQTKQQINKNSTRLQS